MASSGSTPERHNDTGARDSDAPLDSNTSTSKATVRKDRACPFCHQTFTSSSLGRHLDFFIREKNPKPPDGIHDVQQIRKMRENITRRHTRIPSGTVVDNSSRRWSVTSIASPKSATRPPTVAPIPQKRPINPNQPADFTWTAKNWTATGVINNLPPRGLATPLPRILPRPDAYKSQSPQLYASLDEMDDARAAELALREVLGLIKSAASSSQNSPLFKFDFYAYSFPALCLRVFAAPSALFSTTPLTSPNSWPISLPDQSHLVSIREQLMERIASVEGELRRGTQANSDILPTGRPAQPAQYYQSDFKAYFEHLDGVFQQWQNLAEPQKLETWHLELLRAYAQEMELKDELQHRLDTLETDNHRLKTQVEEIRTRQFNWQQTGSTEPPRSTSPPLPKTIGLALTAQGLNLRDWDYDKLIAKYRPTVQKARRQSASHGVNDIRNAHERVLSTFGPPGPSGSGSGPGAASSAVLLRPIVRRESETETLADGGEGSGREDGESQDGDGEEDGDVDMEDEVDGEMQEEGGGGGKGLGRQGAG